MASITIEPVEGKAGRTQLIDAQYTVMRDVPHWVPPLRFERQEHLDPKKNVFLANMDHQFWVARRNGRLVGRISAQVNRAHLKIHDDATGQFGNFDSIDDIEVARALVNTACGWLKERGMRCATGPFSHGINEESGLLIDGFDTPPQVMMPHNPAYYGVLLEELDFQKAVDLVCFKYIAANSPRPVMQKVYERYLKNERIKTRMIDKSNLQSEIDLICDIFNDAWANNWGFIPFGKEEARYLANNLKLVIDPKATLIAEVDGQPAGMILAIPNINEAARDLDGRLFPFGFIKLLWRLKVSGTRSWRLPLMGIRQSVQASNLGGMIAVGLIESIRHEGLKKNVEWAELSWILEHNKGMRTMIEALGAAVYKTYRVYEKGFI